jgi:8-oxo-dGTP pyrophosphatase MutT (NUDIX family)
MSNSEQKSGFRPVGDPEITHANPWFTTVRQPMDFVDPETGRVRKSAADGGAMNYLDINAPGVLIVTDLGGGKETMLVPQERHTTNLVEGRTVRHYELPGGGIDGKNPDQAEILEAARRELEEEIGFSASKILLLGSRHRGLMAHPLVTDHNYTALALDAQPTETGPRHEDNEVLGSGEAFTWAETREMSLNPDGLWVPEANRHKVISSGPTVASLALASMYFEQRQGLNPVTIPLS